MSIRLSYSSVSKYKQCPTKYQWSKEYKSKKIPSVLPFGKAVEEGVTALLLGEDLPTAISIFTKNWKHEDYEQASQRDIYDNLEVDYYATDFDKNLIGEDLAKALNTDCKQLLDQESWQEAFESIASDYKKKKFVKKDRALFYRKVLWECCRARGQVMLESFYKEILPQVESIVEVDGQPLIQKQISFKNADGDEVIGYVDYVLKLKDIEHPIVFDLKTSYARYSDHQVNTSEQLKVYSAALLEDLGVASAGYIVIVKKVKVEKACNQCGAKREGLAKKCKKCKKGDYANVSYSNDIQLVYKTFKEEELIEILDEYSQVATAIKNSIIYKNAANCMMYNRKCDFYDLCWNKKKPSDLKYLEQKQKK